MTKQQQTAITAGLVVLAVPQLVAGIWAVANPRSFFSNYPGLGQHWVAANPPYNHHLVIDAGSGFLATGIGLALAVLWRDRRVRQVVLAVFLVQAVPHAAFHLIHPASVLSASAKAGSTGGLVFGSVLGALLLVLVSRAGAAGATGARAAAAGAPR